MKIARPCLPGLLLAFTMGSANAYSGAGGECGNPKLEAIAAMGTPEQLQAAIDADQQRREDFAKPAWQPRWYWEMSRKNANAQGSVLQAKRQTYIRSWVGCEGVTLLDVATAGRNLDNVKYLLKAGADPEAPGGGTVLMRCPFWRNPYVSSYAQVTTQPADIARTIAVYSALIKAGVKLNQTDEHGNTALHLCQDPIVIALLLQSGANPLVGTDPDVDPWTMPYYPPSQRILDVRVLRMMDFDIDEVREANFASLLLILPKLPDRRLTHETERRLRSHCEKNQHPLTCDRLHQLLTISEPPPPPPPPPTCQPLPPAPPPGATALHLIEVNEGKTPPGVDARPWWAKCNDGLSNNPLEEGSAQEKREARHACQQKYAGIRVEGEIAVTLTDDRRPMVLVLVANDPAYWKVSLKEGVAITKVILVSNQPQRISGLPSSVPVENQVRPESDSSRDWDAPPEGLVGRTGLKLTSFQRQSKGVEFAIPPKAVGLPYCK